MVPATRRKTRKNLRQQISQQWLSLTRDRLGIFALTLFVLGLTLLLIPIGALQGVGGIVFGTGLTVLISTWSNRQQLAKEANLRRKTEVYGPLHAELQTLRERLEEARVGSKPFLLCIDVQEMEPSHATQLLNEEPPRLHCWPEFKTDYRYLDFSNASRQMLDQTLKLAQEYNMSIEKALVAFETILASCIQTAISRVVLSLDFQQWSHASSLDARSSSPDDAWFTLIDNARHSEWTASRSALLPHYNPNLDSIEDNFIPKVTWATFWLRGSGAVEHDSPTFPRISRPATHRPETLGWLLAGNPRQALEIIRATGFPEFTPPPIERLQDIMDEAWPALESDLTYLKVRSLHEELFQQVFQAEAKLLEKLRYIQDIYEGGPPPL